MAALGAQERDILRKWTLGRLGSVGWNDVVVHSYSKTKAESGSQNVARSKAGACAGAQPGVGDQRVGRLVKTVPFHGGKMLCNPEIRIRQTSSSPIKPVEFSSHTF